MSDSQGSSSVSSSSDALTLDEAIERCVLELERGESDPQLLIDRYPKWRNEIAEFLANWGSMERYAVSMSDNPAVMEPDWDEVAGRRFCDYELIEKIGIGGMGVIYKARQISLDRIVALKMILGHRRDRDRFRLEAEAAAALSHPNIVSIYEIGEHEGRLFFSMQLIDGCNLKQYLEQHQVSPRESAEITMKIARAVNFAHQRGILHRDLKPANVMMASNGEPHITDFGLAKQIDRDTEITKSGTIMGTPGYMAPEQASAKNKNLTVSTDVYGLGAILYALLTGEAPFTGDSSLDVLRRVVDDAPVSPRANRPELDRDIETICLKCLEKTPEHRYGSAEQLAEDLQRFLNHEPVLARPVPTTERIWRWCQRNSVVVSLSVLAVVLLISTTLASTFWALSEHEARVMNQQSENRERRLLGEVVDAENDEEKARRLAEQNRINLYLSNGFWQARAKNVGESLLWFAEAGKRQPLESAAYRANMVHCQSWLRSSPVPVAATMLIRDFDSVEWGRFDRVQFRPAHSEILIEAGSNFIVWNTRDNSQWLINEGYLDVAYATWNPNGKRMAIGCQDGLVLLVDAESKNVLHKIRTNHSINHVAYSPDGRLLGIATSKSFRLWDTVSKQFAETRFDYPMGAEFVAFSPANDRLVLVQPNGITFLVSAETGQVILETKNVVLKPPLYRLPDRRQFWPTFVNDGNQLYVQNGGNEIKLFQTDTGDELRTISIDRTVNTICVSDDGQYLGLHESDHSKVLRPTGKIKAKTERLELRLPHNRKILHGDFSSNGLFATGCMDNVFLWPVNQFQFLAFMDDPIEYATRSNSLFTLSHQARIRRIAFAPDNRHLLTVQVDGLVRLWRVPDFQTNRRALPFSFGGTTTKIVDERRWMSCGSSKWTSNAVEVQVFDNAAGRMDFSTDFKTLRTHGHLLDAAISPGQSQLVTLHGSAGRSGASISKRDGTAGKVLFWDFPEIGSPSDHIPMPAEPRAVAYHPHGDLVAVCTSTMEVVLLDPNTQEIIDTLKPSRIDDRRFKRRTIFPSYYRNGSLAFSPDGESLIAWGACEGLWAWDLKTRELKFPQIKNGGQVVENAEFSHDGQHIVISGGRNPVARVVDPENGHFCSPDLRHSAKVNSARFSPNGDEIVTSCADGQVRVFNWRDGTQKFKPLQHNDNVRDAVYTPNSRQIVSLSDDYQMQVWDANVGCVALRPITTPFESANVIITPDSRYAIVSGGTKQVVVIDLKELMLPTQLTHQRLALISQLLSNKTIVDDNIEQLSSEQWLEKWKQFSSQQQIP